jgi:hypothetical protein
MVYPNGISAVNGSKGLQTVVNGSTGPEPALPVDYNTYLQSTHWKETRSWRMTGYCERCRLQRYLVILIFKKDLNVHHKHYNTLGRERWGDLEVLCPRCHTIEHYRRHVAAAARLRKLIQAA